MKRRIAITGAAGFVGTALARRLLASGAEVHALSRRPVTLPGVFWQAYELGGAPPAPAFFATVDAVVHAAFSMESSGPAQELQNISAAQQLLALTRAHARPLIFISSMSAHSEAASSYGRAKWAIEQLLDLTVDALVRPGLIVGPGGLYARMVGALRVAPIVPVFYGGNQPIQPVDLEDVVEGLVRILEQRLTGCFNLGSLQPITMRTLYARMLTAAQLRRPVISLPGDATLHLLRLAERLGLRLPLTAENLLGQKHLRSFETATSFDRLGIVPTPLDNLPWASPSPRP